mmetsp:Transcript_37727/g.104209  ORF Transcript_37727/g.104209 Transcript_37727/m.104209 type:complete len:94 (-) Transcript_37727:55-336(-)
MVGERRGEQRRRLAPTPQGGLELEWRDGHILELSSTAIEKPVEGSSFRAVSSMSDDLRLARLLGSGQILRDWGLDVPGGQQTRSGRMNTPPSK